MTPLIDVVFLLLTFFIFALVLMVRADVLDVKLPEIGAGEAPEGELITIALDQDGQVLLEGRPTELAALGERVRALRSEKPEARLVIAVDREGRSGELIKLADTLAAEGLGEFSIIGTRPAEGAPGTPGGAEAESGESE